MKKFTLEDLKKLKLNPELLEWYQENIKTENLRDALSQVNEHNQSWCRLIWKQMVTKEQAQRIALFSARQVLPVFEAEYPNDTRVRECINAADDYLSGKVSLSELIEKQNAAVSAASAVRAAYASDYAASYASYTAYAASYAASAVRAAYASDYVVRAAAAASYAADGDARTVTVILNYVCDLLDEN